MSLALLFPGQGAQHAGMLHTLPDGPAAHAAVVEATAAAGPLDYLDQPAALATTTGTQLALLIAGVTAARALVDDYRLRPEFVAGHSVGAFAAAVTAGVLTVGEAVVAVRIRGELMRQACADGRWGMGVGVGLRLPDVRTLAADVGTTDDPLWIANINAADQITLGGTREALARTASAARVAGARKFELLDMDVASHGPIQEPTARSIAEHLASIPRDRRQTIRYLTNVGGRSVRDDPDAVLDDLAQSVAHPVQWYDASRLMGELGATVAVEMPPGHVLTGLVAGSVPAIHAIALAETGIERTVATVLRGGE
ncbi:acyltransferase domain-containing protein [Nocardia jiangxiensis]|uniref:[acyl-carrier-protein] S-malonyltransferase n=1 Tax=Nocardia jiangxiensis TaxID=282685 RepID=A0ABW6SBT8_9NOCA